jgi:hypothetical protein
MLYNTDLKRLISVANDTERDAGGQAWRGCSYFKRASPKMGIRHLSEEEIKKD